MDEGNRHLIPTGKQGSRRSDVWSQLSRDDRMAVAKRAVTAAGFPERLSGRWFEGRHAPMESSLRGIAGEIELNKIASVLLSGGTGTGKSSLLSAMAKLLFLSWAEVANAPVHQLSTLFASGMAYMTHTEFINKVHSEFKDDGSFSYWTTDRLTKAPLLIIDDLGSANCSEYNLTRLEELIDYRYSHKLPLWMASNFSSDDLKGWPGWQRITSRFSDKSWLRYFPINDEDRRKDPLCV